MKNVIFFIFVSGALFAQPVKLDFQSESVGKFPKGWSSKDEKNMAKVYSVAVEGENKFLHASANSISVTIGYDTQWNLIDYPKLSWRWRPVIIPVGTNEREKSGNDNVLGVYVVFGGLPVPKTIKYIWSETLPVGTKLNSPFSSKTKMLVVRSGKESIGEWHSEERNVLDDYRALFGEPSAKPTAKGIAVLTDSDNTGGRAVGDYDDFILAK